MEGVECTVHKPGTTVLQRERERERKKKQCAVEDTFALPAALVAEALDIESGYRSRIVIVIILCHFSCAIVLVARGSKRPRAGLGTLALVAERPRHHARTVQTGTSNC